MAHTKGSTSRKEVLNSKFTDYQKMNQNVNSDPDFTMAACLSFENILRDIQVSNLNFLMEVHLFSSGPPKKVFYQE